METFLLQRQIYNSKWYSCCRKEISSRLESLWRGVRTVQTLQQRLSLEQPEFFLLVESLRQRIASVVADLVSSILIRIIGELAYERPFAFVTSSFATSSVASLPSSTHGNLAMRRADLLGVFDVNGESLRGYSARMVVGAPDSNPGHRLRPA